MTHPEPLPADHPLWDLDNALITPHLCGNTQLHANRFEALFLENLEHFAAGRVGQMRNVFDPHWEY